MFSSVKANKENDRESASDFKMKIPGSAGGWLVTGSQEALAFSIFTTMDDF